MQEFKKRRSRHSQLVGMVLGFCGVALLVGVTFVLARGAWDMYGKFAGAAAARAAAEQELADLQGRYAKVTKDVAAFESERGLEEEVRQRYGLGRPGEGQIDIVRPASTTDTFKRNKGFWAGLWELLFVW